MALFRFDNQGTGQKATPRCCPVTRGPIAHLASAQLPCNLPANMMQEAARQ
jgi:hypothetical protein